MDEAEVLLLYSVVGVRGNSNHRHEFQPRAGGKTDEVAFELLGGVDVLSVGRTIEVADVVGLQLFQVGGPDGGVFEGDNCVELSRLVPTYQDSNFKMSQGL